MQTPAQTKAAAAKRSKPTQPILIYRPTELARMLSVGRTTLYQWEREGRFPRRVNLAPGVAGWLVSDVTAWLESKAANVEAA